MEKISGIIPSSARVSSVDLRDSHPVRPGVPSFGRLVGSSPPSQRITRSHLDTMLERPMTDREVQQYGKAKIIDDLSSGFFMRRLPEAEASEPASTTHFRADLPISANASIGAATPKVAISSAKGAGYIANGTSIEGVASSNPLLVGTSMDDPEMIEPEFLAPGSYLDVKA